MTAWRTAAATANAAHCLSPVADPTAGDVRISRMPDDITIVDLTGLAAQDIAIANWFDRQMTKRCV